MMVEERSLHVAARCWQASLDAGRTLLEAGEVVASLPHLSEAIRISAAYHPEYHFLESGLNTELGRLFLNAGNFAEAETAFTRAIFLHHQNDVALAGLEAAKAEQIATLPAYGMAARNLAAWVEIGGGSVSEAAGDLPCIFQARQSAATPDTLRAVIAWTDEMHKAYHKLAAEPWFLRAKAHRLLGEKELAANDQRRAEDLQPPKRLASAMM